MKNLIYLTTFISVICMIAINANLPAYADLAGIGPSTTGWIVSMNPLMCLIFSFPFAYLSDKTSRQLVMLIGLIFYFASALLLVSMKSLEALFIVKILEGLAVAAFLPASLAFITDIAEKDKLAQNIGSYTAVFNLGFLVAPLCSAIISKVLDLESVFVFVLGCCMVNIFVCLLIFRKSNQLKINKELIKEEMLESRKSDLKTFTWPVLISVSFLSLAFGYACGVYDSVWAYYIVDIGGDVFMINVTYFCYAFPVFLLSKYMGKVADKYKNLAMPIMIGSLVISLCVCTYGFISVPLILAILCSIEGVGNASAFPAMNAAMVKSVDQHFKGRALGIFNAARTGGNFFGVVIAGYLFTIAHYLPFIVNSILMFVAAITVTYCLYRYKLREDVVVEVVK